MTHEIGLPQRIYYNYLGYLYWFTHYTSTHRFLGIRLSSLIKLLAVILVFSAWVFGWGQLSLIILVLFLIWVYLAYWRAGRSGYFKFVSSKQALIEVQNYEKLQPFNKVSCLATGIFSVQDWEKVVLLKPAAYWQAPRGDHGLMVEHAPQKYLYQFFNAQTVQSMQQGWLIYGAKPKPALAISFLSIWGPELTKVQFSIFGATQKEVEPILRSIYLSFLTDEEGEIIRQNILKDIQDQQVEENINGPAD
jgi:hypothetical protein